MQIVVGHACVILLLFLSQIFIDIISHLML